jgi:Mrp family chromosome partitioning ATPase
MSKNFELLQRVAKDEYFSVPEEPVPAPPKAPGLISVQKEPADLEIPKLVPLRKEPPDPEITKLVQRLFLQVGKGSGPKVVAFSGIAREDRSSWICARAGEILAEQAGTSVCMVEASFWSPQMHIHPAAANHAGLAEALTTKGPIRNFAIQLGAQNLWLIPSGLAKPGFYPSVERYRDRFAELRGSFDYILVSAPALSHETEAALLGQLADGVVLVVEANQNRRETVRRAKEQLESAKVWLIGAVLDQRTFPIPEKLYQRL